MVLTALACVCLLMKEWAWWIKPIPLRWWRTHLQALPAQRSFGRPQTGQVPRHQQLSDAPTCQETLRMENTGKFSAQLTNNSERKRKKKISEELNPFLGLSLGEIFLNVLSCYFNLHIKILIMCISVFLTDIGMKLVLNKCNPPKMDTFLRNSSYIFLFLKVLP